MSHIWKKSYPDCPTFLNKHMHNDNTNIQVIVYFIVVGFFVTLLKMILIRLNTDTFFIITHKRHPHPPLLTFILTKSSYVFLHLEHFYMDIHLLFIFSSISLIFSQNKQFLQKIFHSKGIWSIFIFGNFIYSIYSYWI